MASTEPKQKSCYMYLAFALTRKLLTALSLKLKQRSKENGKVGSSSDRYLVNASCVAGTVAGVIHTLVTPGLSGSSGPPGNFRISDSLT